MSDIETAKIWVSFCICHSVFIGWSFMVKYNACKPVCLCNADYRMLAESSIFSESDIRSMFQKETGEYEACKIPRDD